MDYMSTQDQLDIWGQILGRSVSVGQTFTNPLRADTDPGCYLRDYQGIIFLRDHKYAQKYNKMTCIHAVAELMNTTLTQAAVNIYASLYLNKPLSFNITTSFGTLQKGRRSKTIIDINPYTYKKRAIWTKKSYEYWKVAQVKVSDLEELNVFDVKSFYMNDSLIVPKRLCFGYYFPTSGRIKIYQPTAPKSEKFIGTTNKEDVWKTNIGSAKRIITKSCKDLLTLKNQCPEWEIWALQNEGVVCSDLGNFDETVIIYDNDETGIRASQELQKLIPNSRCEYFSKSKDAYDTVIEHGIETFKSELKILLK